MDTRGYRRIHTTGRLTIDNRRCISLDLPNMAKKTLGCALCILDLWLNLGSLNRCQWVLEDRFEYEVFCKYTLVC